MNGYELLFDIYYNGWFEIKALASVLSDIDPGEERLF